MKENAAEEREEFIIDCSINQDKIAHTWRQNWFNVIIFMNLGAVSGICPLGVSPMH